MICSSCCRRGLEHESLQCFGTQFRHRVQLWKMCLLESSRDSKRSGNLREQCLARMVNDTGFPHVTSAFLPLCVAGHAMVGRLRREVERCLSLLNYLIVKKSFFYHLLQPLTIHFDRNWWTRPHEPVANNTCISPLNRHHKLFQP